MKFKTAKYIAISNPGDVHEVLNTSVVIMLGLICEHVVVYANNDCCENLSNQVNLLGFKKKNIKYVRTKLLKKKRGILHWIYCGLQSLYVVLSSSRDDLLFFSSLNPFFWSFFNICSRMGKYKMFHICHNDLDFLYTKKKGKINLHYHLINYIFKYSSPAKHNYFMVLGDSIKSGLVNSINNKICDNIISIIHPYYKIELDDESCRGDVGIDICNKELKIGIAGSFSYNKGYDVLESFNNIVASYSNINIYFFSVTECDISGLECVTNLNKTGEHLSRLEYSRMVKSMDFLFFPYPIDSYKLCASGAVYESIIHKKPIIALKNDYFDFLFHKFGSLGYLYEDEEQLRSLICDLSESSLQYVKVNMEDACNYINPYNYYESFRDNIIKNINYDF